MQAFSDAGRYVFISSVSAHRESARAGATEDDDVHQPPFPDTEEITWETYGPSQGGRASRRSPASAAMRGTIVRPHYIVGPLRPDRPFHVLGPPGGGGGPDARARA